MAKSNPKAASGNRPKPTPTPAAPAQKSTVPPRNYLDRPSTDSAADPLLRKVFWAVAGLALVVLLGLSLGSGINADDKFQNDYSTKLVNYYGTFGQDTSALFVKDGNMHLYGGLFEVVSGFSNKAFGYTPNDLAYHNVRHLWSTFFGWLAILCAALLARHIAGWRAGLITLIIMALSPRFVGDSLMNPKDIPFAAGYVMALYNLARVLDALPRPGRWHLAGLAGGLAIALATRAGGLLPFAYLGMFAGLHFLLRNGGLAAFGNTQRLLRYAGVTLGVAAAGYVLAILFWPYALQSPLKNPLNALRQFAALEVHIRVLFEGENVMSDVTPRSYPVKWILYTIPLAALIGFVGSLALGGRLMRRYSPLWVFLAWFGAIFPVFYIVWKHSVIHDGWRHLTFAYPTLAVAAGLFWNELAEMFSAKKALVYGVWAALGLTLADSAWFIAANPTMPYVYFNPIKGGTAGAYGEFETDYWGVSVRQGLEWMEDQHILSDTMTQPIVIATNMAYSAQKLTAKYGDKVRIKYLKWEKRCDDAWDYALYPTRFLDGSTLQTGQWPPDNAVHIVTAGGAPILAVLKDTGKNCTFGIASSKLGDWNGAIAKFQAELANVPDNDLAWANLAQAYLSRSQTIGQEDPAAAAQDLEAAKAAAEKCLAISPDDTQANNLIGMYWLEKNDVAKAKSQFESALKREPSNPGAYYYLALIARSQGNNSSAMGYLQKAINLAPNFKPAYELAAQIAEAGGDAARAAQLRQMAR